MDIQFYYMVEFNMIIEGLIKRKYLSRPNRFTVEVVDEDGCVELAHLHDPGRLTELLVVDVPILIRYSDNYEKTGRKTKYDVVAISYLGDWVLINSSYHNKLVEELIEDGSVSSLRDYEVEKSEVKYGDSRFDFLLVNRDYERMYLEVKGCTLCVDNVAMFPDAPTSRGKRHVDELTDIYLNCGKSSVIILVLSNRAEKFMPNHIRDPDFSKSLENAVESGVNVIAFKIKTTFRDESIELSADGEIPILFN